MKDGSKKLNLYLLFFLRLIILCSSEKKVNLRFKKYSVYLDGWYYTKQAMVLRNPKIVLGVLFYPVGWYRP